MAVNLFGTSLADLQSQATASRNARRQRVVEAAGQSGFSPNMNSALAGAGYQLGNSLFGNTGISDEERKGALAGEDSTKTLAGMGISTSADAYKASKFATDNGNEKLGEMLGKLAEGMPQLNADGTPVQEGEDTSMMKDVSNLVLNRTGIRLDQMPTTTPEEIAARKKVYDEALAIYMNTKNRGVDYHANKVDIDNLAKVSQEIYQQGADAVVAIDNFRQTTALMNDAQQGMGAGAMEFWRKSVILFGGEPSANASVEALRSQAVGNALEYSKKTKGAISDKEWAAFLQAGGELSNTRAGNLLIMKIATEQAMYKKRLQEHYADWSTREGNDAKGLRAWNKELSRWNSIKGNRFKIQGGSVNQARAAGKNENNTPTVGATAIDATTININEPLSTGTKVLNTNSSDADIDALWGGE